MEFHFNFLPILALLFVTIVVANHATPSSEEYWKKMLPNTPMPKAIQESLKSENGASVNVGNKGVDVSAGKPGQGSTGVHVGKGGTSVSVGPGSGPGPKGNRVIVVAKPGQPFPFIYEYAATKTQLHDHPNVALFFLQKVLKPGTQMNLHFTKTNVGSNFLPRSVAESIPFSSENIQEILRRFDVKSTSEEADFMKETIKECEAKGIEGEEKYCATSLESMLDFTSSMLGKSFDVVTTYAEKETDTQKYVFTGVKEVPGTDAVVCHKQNYAYAVYYCHKTKTTKSYIVSMAGADGTKVKAVVICHTDTSKWNPKHLAFQVLKVEPGTVPICHFVPEDHLVWVPK